MVLCMGLFPQVFKESLNLKHSVCQFKHLNFGVRNDGNIYAKGNVQY